MKITKMIKILALDISTKNIGITLLNDSKLELITTFRLDKETKSKSIFIKADLFLDYIKNNIPNDIDFVAVEEPLMGSINPSTAATLYAFNTLISYLMIKQFPNAELIYLNLNVIRKTFCPELIVKKNHRDGTTTETLSFPDEFKDKKKEYIWNKVASFEQQIEWDSTKSGKFAEYNYDMSDSYALGKAAYKIITEKGGNKIQ